MVYLLFILFRDKCNKRVLNGLQLNIPTENERRFNGKYTNNIYVLLFNVLKCRDKNGDLQ
jgi:hypothetical protein